MRHHRLEHQIAAVERLGDEGLLITFGSGESVLFHSHFLYDVRHQDGNLRIDPNEPGSLPDLSESE